MQDYLMTTSVKWTIMWSIFNLSFVLKLEKGREVGGVPNLTDVDLVGNMKNSQVR